MNLVLIKTDALPKYQFWQMTKQGRIVGLYFNSVEIALEQDIEPGWQYIIECEDGHVITPEGEVST